MTKLAAVPTLDQVAADPTMVLELPHEVLIDFVLKAQGIITVCQTALLAARPNGASPTPPSPTPPAPPATDRLLTVTEAAPLLGVAVKTLYATRTRYPFYVDLHGRPRFSEQGIAEFIRMRQRG
jgi:hypothetical protein